MIRGMPPGTVEIFVQVIEQILLNHYPGGTRFALPDNKRLQLMRPSLGETPSRRITQRNLYAVLQCIDWTNPGDSPMLKASTAPVTGTTVGAFPGRYSTQYQKLAQWVYLVAARSRCRPKKAAVAAWKTPPSRTWPAANSPPAPFRPEARVSSSPIANIRGREKKEREGLRT